MPNDWQARQLSGVLDEGIRGLAAQEATVNTMRQQATGILVLVPGAFIVTAASDFKLFGWWASVAGVAAFVAIVAVCIVLWPRTFGFHQNAEALHKALTESEQTSEDEGAYVAYRAKAITADYKCNEKALGMMMNGVKVALWATGSAAFSLLVAIGWGVAK